MSTSEDSSYFFAHPGTSAARERRRPRARTDRGRRSSGEDAADDDSDSSGPHSKHAISTARQFNSSDRHADTPGTAYEWDDEDFFAKKNASENEAYFQSPWALHQRLERFFVMEVAWGSRQAAEVSVGDILKKIRGHKWHSGLHSPVRRTRVPEITYRDLTQLFTESALVPAFEIRQNCIVLCLPPLTCIVLHDRVILYVNNYLDPDTLLLKLEQLTAAYSKKAEETQHFFLSHDFESEEGESGPGDVQQQHTPPAMRARSMLLDPQRGPPQTVASVLHAPVPEHQVLREEPLAQVASQPAFSAGQGWRSLHHAIQSGNFEAMQHIPRFVLFPLEFAFLEILISYAFTELDKDVSAYEAEVDKLCERCRYRYSKKVIDEVRDIKEPLNHITENIEELCQAFNTLLDTPEDLAMMELTKLFYQPHLYGRKAVDTGSINPNLEILMEFFAQEVGQIQRRVRKLNHMINDAEKHMTMTMSFRRNELHKWDIGCNVAAVGLGMGAVISGTLGMNVPNFQEESHSAFWSYVSVISVCACLSFALAFYVAFKTTS